jgi:hypothetical protein
VHEPLGGEAGKLAAQKAGYFGLIDFECTGSLSLREPPRANSFADANRKIVAKGQTRWTDRRQRLYFVFPSFGVVPEQKCLGAPGLGPMPPSGRIHIWWPNAVRELRRAWSTAVENVRGSPTSAWTVNTPISAAKVRSQAGHWYRVRGCPFFALPTSRVHS